VDEKACRTQAKKKTGRIRIAEALALAPGLVIDGVAVNRPEISESTKSRSTVSVD
jgi:hypothetical protein